MVSGTASPWSSPAIFDSSPLYGIYQGNRDKSSTSFTESVQQQSSWRGGDAPPFHTLDMSKFRRLAQGGILCPLCPKISRDKFNLRDHYMASHSGEKPRSCSLCDYKCIRKQDLNSHFRSKHGQELLDSNAENRSSF